MIRRLCGMRLGHIAIVHLTIVLRVLLCILAHSEAMIGPVRTQSLVVILRLESLVGELG